MLCYCYRKVINNDFIRQYKEADDNEFDTDHTRTHSVVIPTGSLGSLTRGNVGDGFCGKGLANGIVTSRLLPFQITFVTPYPKSGKSGVDSLSFRAGLNFTDIRERKLNISENVTGLDMQTVQNNTNITFEQLVEQEPVRFASKENTSSRRSQDFGVPFATTHSTHWPHVTPMFTLRMLCLKNRVHEATRG
ncbi:uncharacterized protein LOC143236421 [Tachypleus tridentatus]|uniref:uncharacterized protein LOC143236421 n=1 Tax=Tachypleus tridentatus TaxID=6853 RepID=UPI003FD502BB